MSTINNTDFLIPVITGRLNGNRDRLADAIDAAIIFGAICVKQGKGEFANMPVEQLERMYHEKIDSIKKVS